VADRAGGVTPPPSQLVFRPATADDAPRLAALVIEGFESYRAFAPRGWVVHTVADELERVTATLAKPSTWCRLAEQGDRLAGHVGWLAAADSRLPDDDPSLGHFWQLFVRRDRWGSGLATTLHDAAMQAAAERGFRALRLFTPADHTRARRFYEREGWSLHRAPFDDPHFGMMLAEYRRAP
jgi:GNAT superfamily N-acetyltransferase